MKPVFLAALAALLAGCSSLDTKQAGDYSHLRRIYVEHRLTDTHHIDELIAADLKARGYDASCGYLTMMPENTEAIVTYTDRWQWDFKSYLIDLEIEMRANFTGKALARGSYHQASASTKPPEEVVKLILDPLFPKR
jgi:type IV pilus biogenesis protein CpaD/CtpE